MYRIFTLMTIPATSYQLPAWHSYMTIMRYLKQ
jgi:hypothetical protein